MASTSNSVISPAYISRNWLELPPELTASILLRLGAVELLLNARKVCKTWRRICSDPSMWRVVDLRYSGVGYDYDIDYDLEKITRQAVDLSCGELIDISIEHFTSVDLLHYISDRSSQLRRLCLISCCGITNEGLSEIVKKLPLLEELHLHCIRISKQAIEVAGHCCPELKSFKLNNRGYRCPHIISFDEDALAIAENMRGLRHLQLYGNTITIDGLLAILENCPHLESLDIRKCYNAANLGPDLVKALSQQMKDLRLPYDSTEDYEFDDDVHELGSFDDDDLSGSSDIGIDSDEYDYSDEDFDYSDDDFDYSDESDTDSDRI